MASIYSGAVAQTGKSHEALDKAIAEASQKEVEAQEFQYDERKKFEKRAGDAAKGIKKWASGAGALGGIAAVGLGMAALPAALVAGGATLAGAKFGMTGATKSGRQLKAMKKGKWFKGDQQDVRDSINKQILSAAATNAVMTGMTAGAAHKSGVATGATDPTQAVGAGADPGAAVLPANKTASTVAVSQDGAYQMKKLSMKDAFVSKDSKFLSDLTGGKMTRTIGIEEGFGRDFMANLGHAGRTITGTGSTSMKDALSTIQTGQSLLDWYDSDDKGY